MHLHHPPPKQRHLRCQVLAALPQYWKPSASVSEPNGSVLAALPQYDYDNRKLTTENNDNIQNKYSFLQCGAKRASLSVLCFLKKKGIRNPQRALCPSARDTAKPILREAPILSILRNALRNARCFRRRTPHRISRDLQELRHFPSRPHTDNGLRIRQHR